MTALLQAREVTTSTLVTGIRKVFASILIELGVQPYLHWVKRRSSPYFLLEKKQKLLGTPYFE
jgi:hypothetical protein